MQRLTRPVLFRIALIFLTALLTAPEAARAAGASIWIEGEKPKSINVATDPAGVGHPEWLSEGKWLKVNLEADQVQKSLPADGGLIEYAFAAPRDGDYEVWDRVGYEFVRSRFDWRIDSGEWKTVSPKELTTDLMELSTWTEVAWLKLGQAQLKRGDHTLQIRLPLTKDEKGQVERVLYASDAICLSAEPFHPNSKYKPGESAERTPADLAAAKQVFQLPESAGPGARAAVELKGLWEICRNDEQLPGEVAAPIKDFPNDPHWSGIEVPGDKNEQRPDLLMAHRLWYRTRVNVPPSAENRSFFLTFPQNNLNTTVYVNGVYCGFNKNPYVHFDLDITRGIKPGVNEIWVGIRDAWYGFSTKPGDPMKLRAKFNIPPDFCNMGFSDLAYPVWGAWHAGILQTPTLTAAGPVYASDVFVKPSVARKELAVEVTIANPSNQDSTGEVLCEAVDPKTGQVAKSLPPKPFSVAAGKEQVFQVSGGWDNARLWWPDAPDLYTLRTTLRAGAQTRDASSITFGFREWGHDGKNFTLNGIPWHGWNEGVLGETPDEWLAFYHKSHQTQMRLSGATQGGYRPFFGMSPDETLDWMDRNGVPVRRCGILDGEAIGYLAVENDPDLQKLYNSPIKMQLLNNWREQMVAQVKGERNHPSIQLWSIENEWLYINCINLYGGLMDQFEAEAKKTSDAVQSVDPTRLVMTDGGGANKDNSMPVHGNHYVALDNPGGLAAYPNQAYLPNPTGGGRGRWVWDQKRPRYLGEDLFFAGNHPELSTLGGEAAFGGKASTLQACGLLVGMLQQGYRWAEFGAWDFYLTPHDTDGTEFNSFSPRAVFCRQWDWTFGSGQAVPRTLAIFNDTHSDEPIDFTWTLILAGKIVAQEARAHRVAPGTHEQIDLTLNFPKVQERAEGEWVLSLAVGGKEVYRDVKSISILNPDGPLATPGGAPPVALYDPAGVLAPFLKSHGVEATVLADLKRLPESAKVLILGKDALDVAESTSSRLAAYASPGRTVIVLEQKNPLKFQAIPAEMQPDANLGRIGFAEDPDHPVFAGLKQKDFFTWGSDELLYRDAYRKPTRGARSLLQCDNSLKDSALVEVPAGKGLLLLSQLLIEEKLSDNAVARQLLKNLVSYGSAYKQTFHPVTAVVKENPQLARALDSIGVQASRSDDPLEAIGHPGSIAVIDATPANLKALADNLPKVEAFTRGGGWILFNRLTPEGLASYNRIVGWEHMIRPFKRERVVLPPLRRPVMAGISNGDVALYSSKRIFPWQEGNYVVSDEFSYVVDIDDVAPFAKSSFHAFDNIVNGFVNADGWPLIINFPVNKDNSPYAIPMTLPKAQTITEFTWIGNVNYWPTTKIRLIFDGDTAHAVPYDVQPTGDAQTLAVDPPRTATNITLEITGWQPVPGKGALVGIDNISLKAQRPPDFFQKVKPLLNVGGMVEYPHGPGGILLCNLNLLDNEEVPVNAIKKQGILATLLRNLNAPFAGKSVIAGAAANYQSIDISKQANQFRNERGWFGDKQFTFKDLPTGRQTMAGVPFDIYDFPTSPVPTVIMLGGHGVPGKAAQEVKGIPVNRKADALFFLQAARVDRQRSPDEIKQDKKFLLARYVIHYADGKTEEAPIYAEINVGNYQQTLPAAIPGAQIAWQSHYEGTDKFAVAYSMQWNNPRPDVEIASIDLLPGTDNAGVPALIAVTAASAQ